MTAIDHGFRWLADRRTPSKKQLDRYKEILVVNWHQGMTAFGGPNVHFGMFHKKYVQELKWIDEQLYQEIFGICQVTPGPASTKMFYIISAVRGGFVGGVMSFSFWSLPGAIGMYGLALGIEQVGDSIPAPAYALLSGLNAATVGIIALAAVQLAEKAITDKVTRMVVLVGAAAGMLYTALWFFPVLIVAGGLTTLVWDWGAPQSVVRYIRRLFERRKMMRQGNVDTSAIELGVSVSTGGVPESGTMQSRNATLQRRGNAENDAGPSKAQLNDSPELSSRSDEDARTTPPTIEFQICTWRTGVSILVFFLATFTTVMVLRGTLSNTPIGFSLFSNIYLGGTIIFGGGPVVVPLLREYTVAEGWVSPRDFLLGLAIIQAFPGPNFNFAVYLGALTAAGTEIPITVGALIGYVGMFAPGMLIASGVMGVWKHLRSKRWIKSILRGVNAAAVGLVYTAVYRLWNIGFIDAQFESGTPLGIDPWFVTITATSFVLQRWFGLNAPFAILLGGAMGMVWYLVTQT